MQKNLIIEIEKFLNVEKATIELKPLTLFVGKNNTCKTAINSLIYGIMDLRFYNKEKNKFVQRIFSHSGIKIKKLKVNVDNKYIPVYIPSCRTGILLSYKLLASELINHFGIEKPEHISFSLPIIRFAQNLIRARLMINYKKSLIDVINFVEQIIDGTIIQDYQTQTFYYLPKLTSKPLNLFQTPSLVTELAPLLIFLKNSSFKFNYLFFDEPESHLHPSTQKLLAKCLIKLVNSGVNVCITTNSDIISRQIANSIGETEGKIKRLKELSYSDQDIIKKDDINIYQCNKSDNKVSIDDITDDYSSIFSETTIELYEEYVDLCFNK